MNWSDLIWVAAILVGAIILRTVLSRIGRRMVGGAIRSEGRLRHRDPARVERKASTFESTVTWTVTFVVGVTAALLMLASLGVEVGPLITSLGILGVAVGFGAQTLIRDVINGIFIIAEDQFGVGDIIETAGVRGEVMEVTLRRTVLRDENGDLHSVSNSAISVASNLTRDYSRIDVDIAVAYDEDLLRAVRMINEEGERLFEERPEECLGPPRVARAEGFDDGAVTFKVLGDVKPGMQWELAGELRTLLSRRFHRDGLRLPGQDEPADAAREKDVPATAPEPV